ncbi:LysR family transcriptional regulator [Nocardioides campestrisoli]|uniref:LysR family transcriptional regulator n=1 Tax=Nocardioides campestrisoli TaxID=2736757 RepID=UPI0015E754AD|nr:LysR family transcriptional regulator [Nocardioides campestrisoli]
MRVEQLECLVAVTRHGSLRRASEHLHLSQPALSESITRLERELGVLLLDRRRSGARISRDGRELLPYVEAVLESVSRLRKAAGDTDLASRLLRVGTVSTATSTLLNPVLRTLAEERPESRIEVVNARQEEIDEGLRRGSLDVGLVNVLGGDDPPAGLVDVPLLTGPVVVVMPADHAFTAREEVAVSELLDEPFVAMREGYLMHRLALRVFGTHWPRAWASTDGAELGKAMVADGAGLTFLPRFSVDGDALQRAGAITHRPLAGLDEEVHLVVRTRAQGRRTAPLDRLLTLLQTRAAGLREVPAEDRIA